MAFISIWPVICSSFYSIYVLNSIVSLHFIRFYWLCRVFFWKEREKKANHSLFCRNPRREKKISSQRKIYFLSFTIYFFDAPLRFEENFIRFSFAPISFAFYFSRIMPYSMVHMKELMLTLIYEDENKRRKWWKKSRQRKWKEVRNMRTWFVKWCVRNVLVSIYVGVGVHIWKISCRWSHTQIHSYIQHKMEMLKCKDLLRYFGHELSYCSLSWVINDDDSH